MTTDELGLSGLDERVTSPRITRLLHFSTPKPRPTKDNPTPRNPDKNTQSKFKMKITKDYLPRGHGLSSEYPFTITKILGGFQSNVFGVALVAAETRMPSTEYSIQGT